MIDRKALGVSLLILLAMAGATLWRLSLLPDWSHVPMSGPGEHHTVKFYALLIEPAALLFAIAVTLSRKWFRSGTEQAMQRWQRWHGNVLVICAVLTGVLQAFIIARSLGVFSTANAVTLGRIIHLAAGILIMALGNALPKMPFLTSRLRPFRLDPFQWNRHLRFAGTLLFAMGLVMAVSAPLLPTRMLAATTLAMCLAMMAANLWHRLQVRREPSPLS